MRIKFDDFQLHYVALGYGWLIITINSVVAKTKFNSTDFCDGVTYLVYGKPTPCDPYVTVSINGTNVFNTTTKYLKREDESKAYFFETYKTEKIYGGSNITFEVYDYDHTFWGTNDLLLSYNTTINDLPVHATEYTQGENSITLINLWQNEYDTE